MPGESGDRLDAQPAVFTLETISLVVKILARVVMDIL
jgi:hypothetical protein